MNLVRSITIVSIVTFISRISGYIRDIIIATQIGAGPLNDAFITAFKLVNMFRTIFGEGAFSAAFVPTFSAVLKKQGAQKALQIAAMIQSILLLALFAFSSLMMWHMDIAVHLMAPGLSTGVSTFAATLGRIVFPYLTLISMCAFYGGILHSHSQFWQYAATSVLLNLCMIILPIYIPGPSIAHGLVYAIVVAGVVEFLWMIFFLKKHNILITCAKPRLTPEVKTILRKLLPGIFAAGITQAAIWIDMIILSFFEGAVSYLYFADRILQLPVALSGTAISTVLLPFLSGETEKQKTKELAILSALLLTVPSAFGIILLAPEIVSSLFQRGKFNREAVGNTAKILTVLSTALPAFSVIKVLTSIFHSSHNTSTPMKIALLSLSINILCGLGFMPAFGYLSVALATAISSWLNAVVLCAALYRTGLFCHSTALLKQISKLIIAALLMSCSVMLFKHFFYKTHVSELIAIVIAGGMIYFAFILKLRVLR